MTTGDLRGSLRKIERGLRMLNYPRDVDYTVLVKGDPAAFLPIISYSFTSFSTYIAELLVKCDVELTAKSDLRFIEAIYKLLRDQFHYKPILTKEQFLQIGFAERKMQIVCDVINCVVKKHKELSSLNKAKSLTRKKVRPSKHEVWSDCGNVLADLGGSALNSKQHAQKMPLVERHSGNEVSDDLPLAPFSPTPLNAPSLPAEGANEEELYLDDVMEVKCEQVIEDNSQIEFLRSQLADCQEKLHKLDWMEDKRDLSAEFSSVSQDGTSGIIPVSPGIEKEEEMTECLHQSSGYSSLVSTDPSPKAVTINSHDLTDISKETTRQRMERISKIIEETSELLKTSSNTSENT
ncbi:centrosomal protein of 44 kDa isoform X3 [Numida meleagris]|uniref:centrosomal protein of 44 kDa isoform X3 n=1 Tax=Numida meleagris TaxID=8996 RepID=UPI000B3D850A|nr:centrosomal protein of 44 kDa isoform X3 [Numida meleagris]